MRVVGHNLSPSSNTSAINRASCSLSRTSVPGVASNIEISGFDYALVGERERKKVKCSFVETGIPMLVPGARRDTLLLSGADDMGKRLGVSCAVTLCYSERGLLGRTKHREEEFLLDMGSFAGSLYMMSDFHDMVVATKSMAKSLERMSK